MFQALCTSAFLLSSRDRKTLTRQGSFWMQWKIPTTGSRSVLFVMCMNWIHVTLKVLFFIFLSFCVLHTLLLLRLALLCFAAFKRNTKCKRREKGKVNKFPQKGPEHVVNLKDLMEVSLVRSFPSFFPLKEKKCGERGSKTTTTIDLEISFPDCMMRAMIWIQVKHVSWKFVTCHLLCFCLLVFFFW